MVSVSRTLGPLHLEDLEPHRFEDLVRQLLYDFRDWRQLEATGRTGSDEGFDARAIEIGPRADQDDSLDSEEETPSREDRGRQWLIQCKREKNIGPKKLESYLSDLPNARENSLYGLVFAAASEFSIKARRRFYERAGELGFQEVTLWGKAEIEDLLFQPKNDHLLFAYFGVSLQTRRRTVKTEVRARLAMKRKAKRILESAYAPVLVRDATDDRYPELDSAEEDRYARGRWGVWQFKKCGALGVELEHRRHFAFIDDDGVHWDFAERMNDAHQAFDDPWSDPTSEYGKRADDFSQWNDLPEANKAWFETQVVLPYDAIIDIDEDGDEYFEGPHLYVAEFTPSLSPPFAYSLVQLATIGRERRKCDADFNTRVKFFPRKDETTSFSAASDDVDDDDRTVEV